MRPEGKGRQVRPLGPEDAQNVASLEREIFSDPWSFPTVERAIEQACGENTSSLSYGAYGVWTEGRLRGYFFSMAVAGEGELHRIAVSGDARREGLGSVLMDRFFRWLEECGCGTAFLEVREGNLPAAALYRKSGFVQYGRRRNYYREPEEDALLFRYQ